MKRAILVVALFATLALACGGSGGGSGDDELRLSNMRASISADPDLQQICQDEGFEQAYVYVADYDGDLEVGDRVFERITFLPSGSTTAGDFALQAAGAGSGIGPNEVGSGGCFTGGTDNRLRVEFYIVTLDGVESNTASDTFNI